MYAPLVAKAFTPKKTDSPAQRNTGYFGDIVGELLELFQSFRVLQDLEIHFEG
jgi:hypothetical protein